MAAGQRRSRGWQVLGAAVAMAAVVAVPPADTFTIRGRVTMPDGHPVDGYPVHLLPALPRRGLDKRNEFYRIPNRNVHRTMTDADGRFTMTGVKDYPEVTSHTYRVVRAGAEERFPFDQVAGPDYVRLGARPGGSRVINLDIKFTPVSQVIIRLRDRRGRPFTGTRAVTLTTDQGRARTATCEFEHGQAWVIPPTWDRPAQGRVILLPFRDAVEAMQAAAREGVPVGPGVALTYRSVGERRVNYTPGQNTFVEFELE